MKDKLATRANKSFFLSFLPGQKGYKLFDTQELKAVVSRDVQFLNKFSLDLDNDSSTKDYINEVYLESNQNNGYPELRNS